MDVLVQMEAIEKALDALGYPSVCIPFGGEVHGFIHRLNAEKVDMVFNLCETVNEDPKLAGHPAALLELLGIPFSGSSSFALMLTTDKLVTKRLLKANGIKTPNYLIYNGLEPFCASALRFPVIVKPRFEDASIGIDQESIFIDEAELRKGLRDFFDRFGTLLVEEYIDGREFNVSIFGYPFGKVLPIAEIDFSQFPENLYHIVGYRAKWDKTSFEYHHTPRRFPQDLSKILLKKIEYTVLECFRLLMLRDFARVDIKVDGSGRIYILEVNANPCLSPDAGFVAAVEKAGMTYSEMVSCFVDFMIQRALKNGHQAYRLSG